MFALQLYNFLNTFSYLWMQPRLAFITFRRDIPVVFYRITNIDNIQSNTTHLLNVIRDLVGNNNKSIDNCIFYLAKKS